MRKFFSLSVLPVFCAAIMLVSGCKTTPTEEKPLPKTNLEERIKHAEAIKTTLLKQLEHPESVDETIKIKDALSDVQTEIEELKSGKNVHIEKNRDKENGFKSTEEKQRYYGPLGIVLHLTQWILEKLYVIHGY